MASSILPTANTTSPVAAQSNTASTLRANRQSSANSALANRSQASGQRPSQIGGNGARNNQMTERVDQLVAVQSRSTGAAWTHCNRHDLSLCGHTHRTSLSTRYADSR